jgi:hypothetical protein
MGEGFSGQRVVHDQPSAVLQLAAGAGAGAGFTSPVPGVWMRVCEGVAPGSKPVPGVWILVCVAAAPAPACAPAPAEAPPRPCENATEETARILTIAMEDRVADFMMDVL